MWSQGKEAVRVGQGTWLFLLDLGNVQRATPCWHTSFVLCDEASGFSKQHLPPLPPTTCHPPPTAHFRAEMFYKLTQALRSLH